ncbi:hypothetical protein WN51_06280 [Melipona quadrifasciata]|uniref:Uncharacterized protein n=1 Tax=Melipona quadrifasciata TaxID=166423 RepID=A0A0N0U3J8_9HYME|nr:hypothetical protein WN51_06280 [Melipona quadrifasciata]
MVFKKIHSFQIVLAGPAEQGVCLEKAVDKVPSKSRSDLRSSDGTNSLRRATSTYLVPLSPPTDTV